MAGPDGNAARALALSQALARALEEAPWKFDFFQAIRRLECLHPDRPRMGRAKRPMEDPVRLRQEPSMAFAPSTLASFRAGEGGRPMRLAVYFLGLLGPNGPLPIHLTEHARDRVRNHQDRAFSAFLDVFHHRALAFFYRAWAASRPHVHRDRPKEDRYAAWVGSLFGIGMDAFLGRDAFPDGAKLHYAGRFSLQTRNAEGLAAVLSDFFGAPASVESFHGRWLDVPTPLRWRLGSDAEESALGRTTTLGEKVWDRERAFRIAIGPLTLEGFRSFLPGSERLTRLRDLVRNYAGDEHDFDVNLVLRRDEVPEMRLGGDTGLGVTTWLSSRPMERDPDDVVLRPAGETAREPAPRG